MMKKIVEKYKSNLPVSSMPCKVAVDKIECTPEDFFSLYGTTKEKMKPCSKVHSDDSHYNYEQHKNVDEEEQERRRSQEPAPIASDYSDPAPHMAEILNTNGRNAIVTCANHAQGAKSNLIKKRAFLQFFRPQLNPGESPDAQRMFDKWRRDKVDKVNTLLSRNVNIRNRNKVNQLLELNKSPINNIPDETETYADSEAKPEYGMQDLLDSIGEWEQSGTEKDEPNMGYTIDFED